MCKMDLLCYHVQKESMCSSINGPIIHGFSCITAWENAVYTQVYGVYPDYILTSFRFGECYINTCRCLLLQLLGMSSHLVLSPGSHTTFLMPSNLAYTRQNLLLTHYWNNCDIPHSDQTLRAGD